MSFGAVFYGLLFDLYWNKKLSTIQIAKKLGVSRWIIRKKFKEYGIKTRSISKALKVAYETRRRKPPCSKKDEFSRVTLFNLYVNKELSLNEIAGELATSSKTVSKYLKEHGVKTRSRSERWKIKEQRGDMTEIKKKRSKALKRYWKEHPDRKMGLMVNNPSCNPNVIDKIRMSKIGEKNASWKGGKVEISCEVCGKTVKVKPCLKNKQRFCSKRCFYKWQSDQIWKDPKYKRFKEVMEKHTERPTTLEKAFMRFIEKFSLPIEYCGNGEVRIGNKIPDFIAPEHNCIFETIVPYWKIITYGSVENYVKWRKNYFEGYGYKTLVIINNELNQEEKLLKKVESFLERNN